MPPPAPARSTPPSPSTRWARAGSSSSPPAPNAGKGASWTSFPAKPAYLELMNEILAHSIRSKDYWMNVVVGESLQTRRRSR